MKRLRQSNKGFTLAEICVVMVIISVLASVTTFSLIAWTHESQFNKQEQNAELIYMAIRNKMAVYKANGALFEITGMSEYNPDGENSLSLEQVNGDSIEMSSKANYNYVFCNIDDYKKYKKLDTDQDPKSSTAKILFDLLSGYIYDGKKVLNAYISIEFDKTNGDVIGVYYSDRTPFYYNSKDISGTTEGAKRIEDIKASESLRYECLVGAYRPG